MAVLDWAKVVDDFSSLDQEEQYFCYQIEKGWDRKLTRLLDKKPELIEEYTLRLQEEVGVILRMQFPSYFLITQDFLVWCDTQGIRRGPGRGSAGGCLIAYLMDITRIDPIKYGLLFSRFLNADRVSMPDIDNDIETDRRDEVKQYLKRKYGEERVASIGTFGTMKVRAAVKDIIRSLNLGGNKAEAFKLADKVNSLMPNDADITFDDACKQSPEFKSLVWYPSTEEYEKEGWKLRMAGGENPSKFWRVGFHVRKMEGMIRQTGTHAAGVLVSPMPLDQVLPMAIDKNNVTVTANSGKMCEDAGFLKIDLLGLNTLSIIERCVQNIEKTRGKKLRAMPLNGAPLVVGETEADFEERMKQYSEGVQQASRAYRLCRLGKTEGVFQCESAVAKQLLQDLQSNSIEDLSAVLALNRPGPLKAGLVKEYGGRKFGKIKWDLPHPATKEVLEPTYGILAYQEQCMQLAVQCAGFTMAEADTLRKAIGKKIFELMVKFEKKFVEGCYKNYEGFDKEVEYETMEEKPDGTVQKVTKTGTIAERLWTDIVFFAGYGFNKSHSVAYAHNTYYTAFLKANYPAEFWAAQLSYESDQVKINKMIMEAKADNIQVLPVSINTSSLGYESESPTEIRRSLGTLKSVGGSAIEEICANRPYKSIKDVLLKCNMRKLNKKTIHALICAGAFDEFGITRKTLDEKVQDCKSKLDKWCKRRVDAYIKFCGAARKMISAPREEDLELCANPDRSDEELREKDEKYPRIKKISGLLLKRWKEVKPTVKPAEGQSQEEAEAKALKELVVKWQRRSNQIFAEGEYEYEFVETEEDKLEWEMDKIITLEKEVYGTAVSAHIFDKYAELEKRITERHPTNFYTLDQSLDDLGNGMELVMFVECVGIDRQFPYKKDNTKFVRLFRIEDRFGAGEVTVFDKSYEDFEEDAVGTPIRVWKKDNILAIKVKVNDYAGRRSLVFSECIKLVASK